MNIKLKNILNELLLKEIDNNTSLYHRSLKKMNVGDKIEPFLNGGRHWLSNEMSELALEEERKKLFPNKPSRLNCVYSTLIPRSRFVDKGYLYRIKPIGKMHIADSTLIDTIHERFDRDYYDYTANYDNEYRKKVTDDFKQNPEKLLQFLPGESIYYWRGELPVLRSKTTLRDIEVLSESAIIEEVIIEDEKSTPYMVNDDVVTIDNKLKGILELYINSEYVKDKPDYTEEEKQDLINYISKEVFDNVSPEIKKYSIRFNGNLKKGVKLKIIQLRHSIAQGRGRIENKGKYDSMLVDFYGPDGNLISRDTKKNGKNLSHRFTIALFTNDYNKGFYKHLKKI